VISNKENELIVSGRFGAGDYLTILR